MRNINWEFQIKLLCDTGPSTYLPIPPPKSDHFKPTTLLFAIYFAFFPIQSYASLKITRTCQDIWLIMNNTPQDVCNHAIMFLSLACAISNCVLLFEFNVSTAILFVLFCHFTAIITINRHTDYYLEPTGYPVGPIYS